MNSSTFTCKCGQEGWVTENEKTEPCPKCGRKYVGVYDSDKLTIRAREVNQEQELADEDEESYKRYYEQCARDCLCCPFCWEVPCSDCLAGGYCDATCICDDMGNPDSDFYWDELFPERD